MFLFFVILLLSVLISFAIAGKSIAPWIPCFSRDLERINNLADLKSGDRFMEIGCGDGRVSRFIAYKNPSLEVFGIEYFFPLYLYTYLRTKLFGSKNIHILYGNALKYPLHDFNVVYVFGMQNSLAGALLKKFQSDLRSGTKVLSYVFEINGLGDDFYIDSPGGGSPSIYIYTIR